MTLLPFHLVVNWPVFTILFHHICLNASIHSFHLAPRDHPPPLTCTAFAIIFISVHARFILQLQQSRILSLPFFVRLKLKPWIFSENILKPVFSSLLLLAVYATCSAPLIYSTEWLWRLIKFYYLLSFLRTYNISEAVRWKTNRKSYANGTNTVTLCYLQSHLNVTFGVYIFFNSYTSGNMACVYYDMFTHEMKIARDL